MTIRPTLGLTLVGTLLFAWASAGCGCGSARAEGPGAAYPCDPPTHALAAEQLGVEPADLRPGERYPSTGTCVLWSRTHPGERVVVQVDGRDSDPPSWPCDPDQIAERGRGEVNGMSVSITGCTSP